MSLDQDSIRLEENINDFVDAVHDQQTERFRIVAQSDNAATLEGLTPAQIKSQMMDLVNTHINTKNQNVHNLSPDDVGTMSRDEINSYFNSYMQEDSGLPVTSIGDSTSINPIVRDHRDVATHDDLINTGAYMYMDGLGNLIIMRNMRGSPTFSVFVSKFMDARHATITEAVDTNIRVNPLGKYGLFIMGTAKDDSFSMLTTNYMNMFWTYENDIYQSNFSPNLHLSRMRVGEDQIDTLGHTEVAIGSPNHYRSNGDKYLPKYGLEFTIGSRKVIVGKNINNHRDYTTLGKRKQNASSGNWTNYALETNMQVAPSLNYAHQFLNGLSCVWYDVNNSTGSVVPGKSITFQSGIFQTLETGIEVREDHTNSHYILVRDIAATNAFYVYIKMEAYHTLYSIPSFRFYMRLRGVVSADGSVDFTSLITTPPILERVGSEIRLVDNEAPSVSGDHYLELFDYPGCHDLLVEDGVAFITTTCRDKEYTSLRRITYRGVKEDFVNGTHVVLDDVSTRLVNRYNNGVTDDVRLIPYKPYNSRSDLGTNSSYMCLGVNPVNGEKEIDLALVYGSGTNGFSYIKTTRKLHELVGFNTYYQNHGIKHFENLVTSVSERYRTNSINTWVYYLYGNSFINTYKITAPLGIVESNHPPIYSDIKLAMHTDLWRSSVEITGRLYISELFNGNMASKIATGLSSDYINCSYDILFKGDPYEYSNLDIISLSYTILKSNKYYLVNKIRKCKIITDGDQITNVNLLGTKWETSLEIQIDSPELYKAIDYGGALITETNGARDWSSELATHFAIRSTFEINVNGSRKRIDVKGIGHFERYPNPAHLTMYQYRHVLVDPDNLDTLQLSRWGSGISRFSKTFNRQITTGARYGSMELFGNKDYVTHLPVQGGNNPYYGTPMIGGIFQISDDVNWFSGTSYDTYTMDGNNLYHYIDTNTYRDTYTRRSFSIEPLSVIVNGNYVTLPSNTVSLAHGQSGNKQDFGTFVVVGYWLTQPFIGAMVINVEHIEQEYTSSNIEWYPHKLWPIENKPNVFLGYIAVDNKGVIIKNTINRIFQVNGFGLSGFPKGSSIPYSGPTPIDYKELWWS